MMFTLALTTIVAASSSVLGDNALKISNPNELIEFSNNTNDGTTYEGTTVLLDGDIYFTDELSRQFLPIKDFSGTFDGQGHVIRNLKIESVSKNVGLFGYSTGTTIKNVVMDESCSVVNNYILDGKQTYSGGVIGYCYSYVGKCIIENNVNMASILFNGSTNGTFIGGIAGALTLRNYPGHIKNCANYGTVSSTGTSSIGTYIGGVV